MREEGRPAQRHGAGGGGSACTPPFEDEHLRARVVACEVLEHADHTSEQAMAEFVSGG
jgi:hypothetical protein